MSRIINALIWNIVLSLICLETLTSMHVFPATANDCLLQTNSFGLVNRHIFRPIGRNFQPLRSTLNVQLLRTNELLIVFNDETPWTRITKNWCFPEFIILYDISFPLKLLYGGNRERFIFYDTHIVKSSLRVSMFYVSPRTDWNNFSSKVF